MERNPYIYILTNKRNGTLYTGVTSNLPRRIKQHKNYLQEGFTKKYRLKRLVYFESAEIMEVAITREKQIKAGSRKKKIALIEKCNPGWLDLYEGLLE
ncbi:MAG: putative endonuclease [Saprospiraceae bacterium]|jgi:putative endonuclease